MTDMAQHERHRDQHGNNQDPRGQEVPCRAARPPLPGAPATSPTTISLPLRGLRHLLAARELVEYRKTPRKLGIGYGDLVGNATQRSCSCALRLTAVTSIKSCRAAAHR